MKKYLSLSKNNEGKYKYSIPIPIKKILTFFLKLPLEFWRDGIEERTISTYSPIEKNNKDNLFFNITESLLGKHFFYTYNSSRKNAYYKDNIIFFKNATFKYGGSNNTYANKNGKVYFQSNHTTMITDAFTLTFSQSNIDSINSIIHGTMSIIIDSKATLCVKRFFFSREEIKEELINKYLGEYKNHLFPVIP